MKPQIKILLINAHPNPDSLCASLAHAYETGARNAGADVKLLTLSELRFNPNLAHGYRERTKLEPDLETAIEYIQWANHLVWVHPVWWGGLPAIAKGFIDRVFLPGIAFKYKENSIWWDQLLKGKSARIICTLDQPSWYYWFKYGRPSVNQLKKSTLEFCGVKPVRVSYFGPIRQAKKEFLDAAVKKAEKMGESLA